MIDREDMDETGIANLAGKVLGEYVRTKVVPECDAYVLSKIFGIASTSNNAKAYTKGKELSQFTESVNGVRKVVGYDEELVAFVESDFYAALENSPEISRHITVSDFKKGEINTKVKMINGVALIPVVPERMKSAYDFAGEEGVAIADGFAPKDGAKDVKLIVCPKSGAHLVQKSEKLRVFSPEQNLDADAYMLYLNGMKSELKISIKKALLALDWDIVTVQQASLYSYKYDSYQPYISELTDAISSFIVGLSFDIFTSVSQAFLPFEQTQRGSHP
jgi:hypothetical protein